MNENEDAIFVSFNDKLRTHQICSDIKNLKLVQCNDLSVIDILNDKFKVRDMLCHHVPIFKYLIRCGHEMDYKMICDELKVPEFVVQIAQGAGGEGTYLIRNELDWRIMIKPNELYAISRYIKHIPLNKTMIISNEDIVDMPTSVQLIKLTNNRFKYCGGDFICANYLPNRIIDEVNEYSFIIANEIKSLGYRGIIGIDYVYCDDGFIYFMEINPRFQSSSFLISRCLRDIYDVSLAELHYKACFGEKINKYKDFSIEKSFLNCNKENDYSCYNKSEVIMNGYFEKDHSSIYRKVFNYSLLDMDRFEKIIMH